MKTKTKTFYKNDKKYLTPNFWNNGLKQGE